MSNIQAWEIWFIHVVQNLGDWLAPVMKLFTWIGYPQAYMVIIAVIYWSINPRLGMRLAVFLSLTASINGLFKQLIHAPRPYWVDSKINAILVSNGFGMPSGHAQASTVWLLAASIIRKNWLWICAIILTVMVGLSRAYLGVHFPSQVILGWLIGITLIIIYLRCEASVVAWMHKRKISFQVLFVFLLSLLIILLGAVIIMLIRNWELPADWVSNAAIYLSAKGETARSSIGLKAIAGNAGGFFGTVLGIILMDRAGGYVASGIIWKRVIRSIIGLVLMFGIYLGLQAIAPEEQNYLWYCSWRYSGFFLISFCVIYLVPQLFLMINHLSPDSTDVS